jgi:hypothetical protein
MVSRDQVIGLIRKLSGSSIGSNVVADSMLVQTTGPIVTGRSAGTLGNKGDLTMATLAGMLGMGLEASVNSDTGGGDLVLDGAAHSYGLGGSNPINRLSIANLRQGELVLLYFPAAGLPVLKHMQAAASGNLLPIYLQNAADYQTVANFAILLIHDGAIWREVCRNIPYVTGTTPVANGGTGSATAAGARSNLGLADGSFEFGFGDGVNAMTTAEAWQQWTVPYDCTINLSDIDADASGSVVLYIYKCTQANYNPGTHPVVGDSIVASAPPTLSSAYKATDSTLTGWTLSLTKGDKVRIGVTSCSTVKRVNYRIGVTR